jgi:hypothetical protein
MRSALPLAILALILAGRAAGAAADEGVEREIVAGGVARSYRVHVPASWDRVRP